MSSTGEGRDRGAFWNNINSNNDRSRDWSNKFPCFTNTQWPNVEEPTDSLRRTMSGSWWSVKSFQPVREKTRSTGAIPKVSRLSLTQRRRAIATIGSKDKDEGGQSCSSSSSCSSWRTIMNEALQRVDKDAPLPEGQPWRKQQQAMLQTAKRKANRTKNKKKTGVIITVAATTKTMKKKTVAVNTNTTTTHKRKRKGKERIPLEEDEKDEEKNEDEEEKQVNESDEKKDKEEDDDQNVKPFNGKCKKI